MRCFNAGDYKWITICIGFELSDIMNMDGLLCLDNARKTGTGGLAELGRVGETRERRSGR